MEPNVISGVSFSLAFAARTTHEDADMRLRKTSPSISGRAALAAAAVLVLAATLPPAAQAAASPAPKAVTSHVAAASEVTDFSSRARRRYARRGYRNDAAGLAFMGMALGTVGAIVAEQRRRDYYRDNYYYGGGPYYGGRYYGGRPYYGGGYYGY